MIVYLDTSTILRVLLRQRGRLRRWQQWESAFSSELLKVEARRVLDHLRLEGILDDESLSLAREMLTGAEQSISFVRLSRRVLERAAMPMPTVVKTLDALHLASAMLLAERMDGVAFATHDRQQSIAARALGFRCVG